MKALPLGKVYQLMEPGPVVMLTTEIAWSRHPPATFRKRLERSRSVPDQRGNFGWGRVVTLCKKRFEPLQVVDSSWQPDDIH